MRLDKWLWAARFFKTRGLACDAIGASRVRVNGVVVKPAKEVKVGDLLQIRAAEQLWEVVVQGLCEQRRPAVEAQGLYQETEAGQEARLRQQELKKLAPEPLAEQRGRPTKRDRRRLESFRSG